MLKRTVSIAPMMDWTDRHERYFLRLISHHTLLYTEMVTTGAILHGDRDRYLTFHDSEHPIALQLGGSEPADLAQCASIGEQYGYDEINLNVGCPSDRVQSGRFGACLMAEPHLVAECVAAMRAAVTVPVTVKSRIGIDDMDSYGELTTFITTVAAAGCQVFIIHARKAWLEGLSPKENREIPPLRYDIVHSLKRDFPHLIFVINGGITNWGQARTLMAPANQPPLDGVMIGREAYHNPYILATVDRDFYGDNHSIPSRHEIIEQFIPYVEQQLQAGVPLGALTRHILGMFSGMPGARAWRRHISENAHKSGAGSEVIRTALQYPARHHEPN